MKSHFSISIPKPCHEDWSKMTPNAKGRFCQACSKTVVDFTKMDTEDIQNYIANHRNQRICGHIKQSQLDTINLKIPETVLVQQLSFQKSFLLALLLSMGLTLFNCEDEKGKTKKIESIEIVEQLEKATDSIKIEEKNEKVDSIKVLKPKARTPIAKPKLRDVIVEGIMITGDIAVLKQDSTPIDSVDVENPRQCKTQERDSIVLPDITGDIMIQEDKDEENSIGFITVEKPPEFKDTPRGLSITEQKEYFSQKVSKIVRENFNVDIAKELGFKGRHKVFTQFKIDEIGLVTDIKVRGPHPELEKEAIRVLNLLPQLRPANQRGRNVAVVYTLPIAFIAED